MKLVFVASLLLCAVAVLAKSEGPTEQRVLTATTTSGEDASCPTGATGAAAAAERELARRRANVEENKRRLREKQNSMYPPQSTGAAEAAEEAPKEAPEEAPARPGLPTPVPNAPPGGPAAAVEEEQRGPSRPEPPRGRSFVVMRLQLTGVAVEDLRSRESELRTAIAAGFDASLGVTKEHVVIESFEALAEVTGEQPSSTAFLEMAAGNVQKAAAIRFRIEVDQKDASVAAKSMKSMVEGETLQENLEKVGISAEPALVGEPEVLAGEEAAAEEEGISTTGAAAGLAAPLATALLAVAVAVGAHGRV